MRLSSPRTRDVRRALQRLGGRSTAEVGEEVLMVGSGMFDLAWYEAEAGRTFRGLHEAVAHYRAEGADAQLSPNPFFDPGVVQELAPGLTPFGTFLTRKRFRTKTPHSALDVNVYLQKHPEAPAHPYGVLGHLWSTTTDATLLPVATASGPREVTWEAVRSRWREFAVAWTGAERLRRPGFVDALPANHRLPPYPVVEPSPETLVSIIIPTWNRAEGLRRALSSVQAQSWGHWEALVVDDGSVDDTVAVVSVLAEQDHRIRLVQRSHEGVCAARNAGLAVATGGLIAFLDSDNEWQPDYLDSMIRAMQAEGLDAAYGTLLAHTPDGPRYRATKVTRDVLMVANHVDMNVLVVRARLMTEVGDFDTSLRRTVDYDLVLRLAEHTDLVHLPVIGVHYDDRRESADRISVREPAAWIDRVRLKHAVDWKVLRESKRDSGLVSVVLPVRGRPKEVREKLQILARTLADVRWEIVVVDSAEERAVANAVLGSLVHDDRIQYHRMPMRVSFAFAADVGFARTTGETVVFLDFDTLPSDEAVQAMLGYAARTAEAFVVQPVTVDRDGVVATAGAVLGPRHRLPAAFLGDFLVEDLDVLGAGPYSPPLADGRTFAVRAATFADLGGLDPLLDDELELADLGIRMKASDPSARVELLPAARVVRRAPETRSPRSVSSRSVFAERHAESLTATPSEIWSPWGLRVAGWERLEGRAHAVRPVLVRQAGPGRRWVLLTGASESAGWDRLWARALAGALQAEGQDAVVRLAPRATRRLSLIDDVVLALHGSCPLEPFDPETLQIGWLLDDLAPAPRWTRRADVILAASPRAETGGSEVQGPATATAVKGWIGAAVDDLGPSKAGRAGQVLLVGAVPEASDIVGVLQDAGVDFMGVGDEWSRLSGVPSVPWPDDTATWARLLSEARRVVVLVARDAAAEGLVPPPLVDSVLVRGEVVSNVAADGALTDGVTVFEGPHHLLRILAEEPRVLDPASRHALLGTTRPRHVARRLVEMATAQLGPRSD